MKVVDYKKWQIYNTAGFPRKINSNDDFLTPWLTHVLNFFGIKRIDIIAADQMAIDYEKSIKSAEDQINKIKL